MEPNEVQEVEQPIAEGETAQPQEQVTPESEAHDEKPEKTADPVQKRINQLTWKAHEAERKLNAEFMARQQAEARLQQIEREWLDQRRRATMPTLDRFNFDPQAYQQAVDQHNRQYFEQQEKARNDAVQHQQALAVQQQLANHVESRMAEAEAKYPDYREVVMNPALPPLASANPMLFSALITHEQMPELSYHLGKNPAEAHRLAAMPPARAVMELGKLAAKISQPASRAPAPVSTVGGNQRASNAPTDHDSMEDWLRKRQAQLKKR